MAQTPPIVKDGILTYQRGGESAQLIVDSSDWFAWLEVASTFTFRSEHSHFTARKERAGHQRGKPYWRAYHTLDGRLYRAYLGQSEALTLHRLQLVAARLSGARVGDAILVGSALDEEVVPRLPAVPSAQASLHSGTNSSLPHLAEVEERTHQGKRVQPWRSTLPVPLTSFLGREREIVALAALLQQASVRLLTLTGPGGVGKTRLALSLAAAVADTFADDVCFVSLAPISDPEQVLPAIAQALGLWKAGDRPLSDYVLEFLCERHLLLLLDNFEQVAAASPQMATLALSCPHLCLLITSRAALHLSGEYEFPVPPLSTPDLTQPPEPQALAQVAASETTFALRQDHLLAEIIAGWEPQSPEEDQKHVQWAQGYSRALAPYAFKGGYVNLLDVGEQKRVPLAFGANYERLLDPKRAYDPDDVFRSTIGHITPTAF